MLAICYSSSRSPDYGVAGQAAGKMLFSENARLAFSRDWWPDGAPDSNVDFNVRFANQPVDHFGNVEGANGGNDRTNFWLPPSRPPSLEELGENPPEWAVRVVRGETIRGVDSARL